MTEGAQSAGPFPDPGLHLAVVDALLRAGAIEVETIVQALADLDPEGDEDTRAHAAIARVHALPLDPAAVARITELDFDDSNDIYRLIDRVLGFEVGSDDACPYDLHSLAGIERLGALTSLSLYGHGYRPQDLDLGPLRGHPKLAELILTGRCTDAAALESLPALRQLTATPRNIEPNALLRLISRGVTVKKP